MFCIRRNPPFPLATPAVFPMSDDEHATTPTRPTARAPAEDAAGDARGGGDLWPAEQRVRDALGAQALHPDYATYAGAGNKRRRMM